MGFTVGANRVQDSGFRTEGLHSGRGEDVELTVKVLLLRRFRVYDSGFWGTPTKHLSKDKPYTSVQ